ncbi:MAG: MvaI/BcnI family restriction endonuclease [Fusobacteriaceae bacterium]
MENFKNINNYFSPNEQEIKKMKLIQEYIRNEFAFIRMTNTMLDKSIIDASYYFRKILKDSGVIDYSNISSGEKIYKIATILIDSDFTDKRVSYYKPETKKGDPRTWVYGLKNYVDVGDLVYFTIFESKLLVIPLNLSEEIIKKTLSTKFKAQNLLDNEIVKELVNKLKLLKAKGWIKSINPTGSKIDPRDVGDTLERELGIKPNNLISADYKGEIELKSKIKTTKNKTSDTLFSCVPDWNKSKIKSSAEMILTYGYPCKNQEKYPDFIDLYVTVKNKANPQGLYLATEDSKEEIYQYHNIDKETCVWDYNSIEKKIKEKHPKTAWLVAETTKINDENYFRYVELEMTQNPLLSQFIMLINDGYLTFDWRGRVKSDGKNYKDKGHAFRLNPKYRNVLFGDLEKIEI